jgi:hypothetical protein
MFSSALLHNLASLKDMLVNAFQFSTFALFNLLLSDEGHFLFGSMFFYPMTALTLLFLVSRTSPALAFNRCKRYCIKLALRLKTHFQRHRKILLPVKVATHLAYSYFL